MTNASMAPRTTPVAIAVATAADFQESQQDSPGRDSRTARLAGRRALAALGLDSDTLEIVRRPGAPPFVVSRSCARGSHEVALSLTHRKGRAAAIAAAVPALLGIDLECENAISPEHARYFLTARERLALGTHTAATLWALKEAAWKALSLGDDVCFQGLELSFGPSGELEMVRLGEARFPARATLGAPWPGYVLATVVLEDDQ